MIDPPRWTAQRLAADRRTGIEAFRRERLEEPLDTYLDYFETYRSVFETLLERTVDLSELRENAEAIAGDPKSMEALRYLASPFISTDDLKTVAEVRSLTPRSLRNDSEALDRVMGVVRDVLDRRRFPWVGENRIAEDAERLSAVIASACLLATQRTATHRRSQGTRDQERQVENLFLRNGFHKVPSRSIKLLAEAPQRGEFCGESIFGGIKADFILRLWDGRVLAVECKVSNSALNSVKRLNREAERKAVSWLRNFGHSQVVPAAVISGVFKLEKLEEAQNAGLAVFWAHDLDALSDWIESTKQS